MVGYKTMKVTEVKVEDQGGPKGRKIVYQTLDEGVSMSKSTPDRNEDIQFLRCSALWPHVDVTDDCTLYSRFRR